MWLVVRRVITRGCEGKVEREALSFLVTLDTEASVTAVGVRQCQPDTGPPLIVIQSWPRQSRKTKTSKNRGEVTKFVIGE